VGHQPEHHRRPGRLTGPRAAVRFAIARTCNCIGSLYAEVVANEIAEVPAAQAEQSNRQAIEDVLALVRRHGGRATPARRLLLNALFGSRDHRSAEELAAEVHDRAPDVHLSTIYRNLEELERLGVIDSTRLGNGPATYHLASAAHGHLVCEQCGTMIEVPDEIFADLVRVAGTEYGFAINPHRFAVTGRCVNCRADV
jgi:Fur family transcriptional regulator, ferric uptake regulator